MYWISKLARSCHYSIVILSIRPCLRGIRGELTAQLIYKSLEARKVRDEGNTREDYIIVQTQEMSSTHLAHSEPIHEKDSIDLEAGGEAEAESSKRGSDEDNHDPNVIWWDGPNDPLNPRNWALRKKSINIALVSLQCLITPIASAMFAPGVPKLMGEFRSTNKELGSFVVSIFVLGFGIGPLFLAPLSEIYGRMPIYQ